MLLAFSVISEEVLLGSLIKGGGGTVFWIAEPVAWEALKGSVNHRSRFPAKDYRNHSLGFKKEVQWCIILLNNIPVFFFSKVRDGATLILSKMGISQQPEDNQQDVPGESKYLVASLPPKMTRSQNPHREGDNAVLILFIKHVCGARYSPPDSIGLICCVLPTVHLQWFSLSSL